MTERVVKSKIEILVTNLVQGLKYMGVAYKDIFLHFPLPCPDIFTVAVALAVS